MRGKRTRGSCFEGICICIEVYEGGMQEMDLRLGGGKRRQERACDGDFERSRRGSESVCVGR